jgi:hypothetical protein
MNVLQEEQSRSWAVAGNGGELAARRTVSGHTAKRRERGIQPPAAAGPRRAGLCPAAVVAGQGRE